MGSCFMMLVRNNNNHRFQFLKFVLLCVFIITFLYALNYVEVMFYSSDDRNEYFNSLWQRT
jgi:hypothetical protein